MDENTILPSIVNLNQALYDFVLPMQDEIEGLEVMGFDSSRDRPELPTIGLRLHLFGINVDRNRPTPIGGNPLLVPSEEKKDYIVDGKLYENVPDSYTFKHPLPVLLQYQLDTWCYYAKHQIAIDHAILTRFPERGVLYLPIEGVEYQFPIELLDVGNLDDLKENFRERVYRYQIEAWVKSPLQDFERKNITTSQMNILQKIQDQEIDLMEILTQAEVV